MAVFTILDNKGQIVNTGTEAPIQGSVPIKGMSGVLYVDYTRGSEQGIYLTNSFLDPVTGKYYQQTVLSSDSATLQNYKISKSGKYRIPVPFAGSETRFNLNIETDGDANDDTVVIAIIVYDVPKSMYRQP